MIRINEAVIEAVLGECVRKAQVLDVSFCHGQVNVLLKPWVEIAAENEELSRVVWKAVYPFLKKQSPDIEGSKKRFAIAVQLVSLRPAQIVAIIKRTFVQRAVLCLLGRFKDPLHTEGGGYERLSRNAWGVFEDAIEWKWMTRAEAEEVFGFLYKYLK